MVNPLQWSKGNWKWNLCGCWADATLEGVITPESLLGNVYCYVCGMRITRTSAHVKEAAPVQSTIAGHPSSLYAGTASWVGFSCFVKPTIYFLCCWKSLELKLRKISPYWKYSGKSIMVEIWIPEENKKNLGFFCFLLIICKHVWKLCIYTHLQNCPFSKKNLFSL